MSKKKERIEVSEAQGALTGNPFAALSMEGLPEGPAAAEEPSSVAPESKKGRVVLRREKTGRGGKTVIVAGDFASHLTAEGLASLAKEARRACGCGGALAGREIELQGDDAAKVRRFFERAGFRVAGI